MSAYIEPVGRCPLHPILLLVAVSLASCGGDPFPTGEPMDVLTEVLRDKGFEVSEGEVADFAIEDCAMLPSCFGNNATSPYGLWYLENPIARGEGALPADAEGRTADWTLREDEAVVYVGRTSPPAAYFSYTPYVFSRADEAGVHHDVFASISDALNVARIGDQPFQREIAIILTADGQLARRVREILERSGMPSGDIHVMPLDTETLRLGNEADSDRLMMLQRFALFDDESQGREYLDDIPSRVVRVTPRSARTAEPMEIPARTPRASGQSELDLASAIDDLDEGIRAAYSGAAVDRVDVVDASVVTLIARPEACLNNLTNCLGEVSDTVYGIGPVAVPGATFGTPVRLGDAPGERFIAYGVNHEATGRATYSNVVVVNSNRLAGVAAFDSRSMPGSADGYLSEHPEAENLFAVSIMRDCGAEPNCVEVPTGFPGVDLDEPIAFMFRAYLQPGATVSPDPRQLVPERVLHIVP